MNGNTAYVLSKKYVQETAAAFGAVKGAPCKIKKIEKKNGQNIITFEWMNDEGAIENSTLKVDDGTPIYVWEANSSYGYGDIIIYENSFYRCTRANTDSTFDNIKWSEIGSADGNYDIIEYTSYLPPSFTASDRKMYYSIEDWCFYLWNGSTWVKQQKTATYSTLGLVMIDEETLNIDSNGKLSIRTIQPSAINYLFE